MSSSAPKAIGKGALKRKPDGKDDRPPKKFAIVRTYVFHLLRSYVMILYNWLIL